MPKISSLLLKYWTILSPIGVVTLSVYLTISILNFFILPKYLSHPTAPSQITTQSATKPDFNVSAPNIQAIPATFNFTVASDTNLLYNSSFEAGVINHEPKGWAYISNASQSNTKVDNESVHSGNLSLEFNDSGASKTKQLSLGISQSKTSTLGGRDYLISVNIRATGLIGNPVLRIGFIGDSSDDKYQDFNLDSNNTSYWRTISFAYKNSILGKYPFIQILNYQGGKIFIDDLSLYETVTKSPYATLAAITYQNNTMVGDGSVIIDQSGNIYPSDIAGSGGNIGTSTARFGTVYASNINLSEGLNVAVQDNGGQVYNVKSYGATGDGTTDDTSAIQATLDAAANANGGIIYFPPGTYIIANQLSIPNFTDTRLRQKSLRLTGAGPANNFCCRSEGGSILMLRASTGTAKIDTRATGYLEIDHLTLSDDGSDSVPFIQTTNTVIYVHEVRFNGTATGTNAHQDAIILGGTSATVGSGSDAPFQGYGSIIENNEFQGIRRGVYLRTYANGVVIRNNAFAGNTGTNLSDGAAIELDGGTDNDHGNVIANNTIEMTNYVYGIKLTAASNNNIEGNGFYDPTATTLAFYRFESSAKQNMIIDGVHSTAYTTVSDASANTNTLVTSNTGISTHFAGSLNIGNTTIDQKLNINDFFTVDTTNLKIGIGTTSAVLKTQINSGQLLLNNQLTDPAGSSMLLRKNSQNAAWSTLTTLPSLIFNGSATDRPEISWYRGANGWPEFSIREATTANTGATFFSGTGNVAPTSTMTLNLGNVGIGVETPTTLLDVAGNASISGTLKFRAGTGTIQTTTFNPVVIGGDTTGNITLNPSNAVAGGFVAPNVTNVSDLGTSSLLWRNIYGTSLFQGTNQVCDTSGNCTVATDLWSLANGSLFPQNNTVDVLFGASSGITATSSAKFAFTGIKSGTPTSSISGAVANVATFIDGNGNISTTNRQDLTIGNSITYNTTGNVLLSPNGTGNVGIGTTAPVSQLEISSNLPLVTYIDNDTSSGAKGFREGVNAGQWLIQATTDAGAFSSTLMAINHAGGVGFGTTSPTGVVDISGSSTSTASAFIRNTSSNAAITGLAIKLSSTTLDNTSRFINFLDLNGNIIGKIQAANTTSVNYAANGTDMAEYFVKNDSDFSPGDIVSISGTNATATLSNGENDSKMIGIVSTAPSFTGGVEGPNKVLVALIGQVPLKISNTSQPIKPGDLLTSSNELGKAMKATHSGFTIAKALESWSPNSGKEAILAYVNVSWADIGINTAGTAYIPAGSTKVEIKNTSVTKSSNIFITPEIPLLQSIGVIYKNPGISFTVEILKPELKNIPFSWWIVN